MSSEVFDKPKTDMELNNYATLSAIKGRQFGKEVYSSVIKFKDLNDFLEVFPEVQRDIVPKKVSSIKTYILSSLEDEGKNHMRFFSAITVSCMGVMLYDDFTHRVAIDTNNSKLSINDGQHRFEGVRETIKYLEKSFLDSKDKERTAKVKRMLDELNEMVMPIVIFYGLEEREQKQLFSDLNNLSQRPSRNASIRLNQTDIFSRMAREVAKENRYLSHLGVEYDKMSIHSNNPNTILLTTVYKSIKELLGVSHKPPHHYLNEDNYLEKKEYVMNTFDNIFFNMPSDLNVKGKYLTDRSFTIKSICKFIYHAKNDEKLQMNEEDIFKIIKDTDWTHNAEFWKDFGGVYNESTKTVTFGGGDGGGAKGVYNALIAKSKQLKSE